MTAGASLRAAFSAAHGDVELLDAADRAGLEAYLRSRGLAQAGELPARVERAGDGNMNLTLRVLLRHRSFIVKQGRPWVEKYDHIPAPWERTLVEAAFYRSVQEVEDAAIRMPAIVDVDERNHVLVLQDLGAGGDCTAMYHGADLTTSDLRQLLGWLSALRRVRPREDAARIFTNRAMRRLNHEHIFDLPLREGNGLDLDRITRGLGGAAVELIRDGAYRARVRHLGERYLADGTCLVHGDYFPGSWIRTPTGVFIIDPEFCFLGTPEFDYGVMLAHMAFARREVAVARQIVDAAGHEGLDRTLVLGFAGVEIMRRLIGVAQLPLPDGLDAKRRHLELSRALVLSPEEGFSCWA